MATVLQLTSTSYALNRNQIPFVHIPTVKYDDLKSIIDQLVLQVHGADDISLSSIGSTQQRCSTLVGILRYCFSCCVGSRRDEDVVQVHKEKKQQKPSAHAESPQPESLSGFRYNTPPPRNRHYASVRSPFTLVQNARDTMASHVLGHDFQISLQHDESIGEEKQSLIDHAYSPPIASYALTEDLQQFKTKPVQGYGANNSKSLAIEKWSKLIDQEADKVNKFYLNIENQLLQEFNQVSNKVQTLNKMLNVGSGGSEASAGIRSNGSCSELSSQVQDAANKSSHSLRGARFLEPLRTKQSLTPIRKRDKQEKRNIHLYQMKLNIFILYQRFIALSNFRTLNQIGFRKILKKFDKNIGCFEQRRLMEIIDSMDFASSLECTQKMNELIAHYSNLFEGGDYNKAKVRLLDSMSWNKWSTASSFRMGVKCGILIGLIGWSISALSVRHPSLPHNAIYAYRCVGCFLFFLWLWSADVYIWSKYRINYVFIFEFEPRTRLTFLQYFDEAATLSLIYFVNVVIFLKSIYWIPAKYVAIWPTALLIFFILRTFLPIFDYWKSRQCMIDAVFQTVVAPFGRVRFRDFFMGDVLTSLVKVLADLYLALCVVSMDEYYTADAKSFCVSSSFTAAVKPICICAPYWFRFAQCLNRYFNTHDRVPHLPNAVKYGTAMSVTLLGTLHSSYSTVDTDVWSTGRIVWLVATGISTCYLIFWDLVMDWAAFKHNRIKEYPKYWYIIAIVLDVALRYLWTFTLFPTTANPYFHSSFTFFNAAGFMAFIECAELFRRAVWAVFRVENAHVSRKDEFRSYEYVPLFYEHTSLTEQQTKTNKPTSMLLETFAIFVVVLIITVVIVLTK
eukprot:648483_1